MAQKALDKVSRKRWWYLYIKCQNVCSLKFNCTNFASITPSQRKRYLYIIYTWKYALPTFSPRKLNCPDAEGNWFAKATFDYEYLLAYYSTLLYWTLLFYIALGPLDIFTPRACAILRHSPCPSPWHFWVVAVFWWRPPVRRSCCELRKSSCNCGSTGWSPRSRWQLPELTLETKWNKYNKWDLQRIAHINTHIDTDSISNASDM